MDDGKEECDAIDEALRSVLIQFNPGKLLSRWVLVAEFQPVDNDKRQLQCYRQTSMAPWDEDGFHVSALLHQDDEGDET